jgi:Anti-sigma-K factor rskA
MNPLPSHSELLAGYLLGDLTPAEMTAVEELLATDLAAQQELEELQSLWHLMPLSLPTTPEPSPELRNRILAATQAPVKRFSWKILWMAATAGAIATCAGLGWQNQQLQQQLATAQQEVKNQVALLNQSDNRLLPIKAMDNHSAVTGSLVMSPASGQAVLALQKVPKLPPGKIYRIWAILENGEMACGDFTPDAQGQVFMKLPLTKWSKAKTVMVTIELPNAKGADGPEVMVGGDTTDL